jgi:MFS superfamily sulfate permease-like transporter
MFHTIFGDTLTYAWLLLSNWASWLTGGIATALFYLWERYRGKQYGGRTVAVFILFAFVGGSYQTWHDEYTLNNSRSVTREKHVLNCKNSIARLVV